jgi:lipopolysaccharide transport system ATP-binding protein
MYMRLAFAVAAHLEPEILLVDEVLAVGDAAFQKKCLGKMGEVANEGRTVLFVSHNMTAVQNLCTDAVLLKEGQIISRGMTDTVVAEYLTMVFDTANNSLIDRVDRKGTGELIFTAFELRNGNGQIVTTFQSGNKSLIVIYFNNRLDRVLQDVHFAIGIDTHLDQRIAHISNEISGQFIDIPPGDGKIVIRINKLQFAPGRYKATLFVRSKDSILDWIQDAVQLNVDPGDYYKTGKLPPTGQASFFVDYEFIKT